MKHRVMMKTERDGAFTIVTALAADGSVLATARMKGLYNAIECARKRVVRLLGYNSSNTEFIVVIVA
jgi:hypothetical protein